MPDLINPDTFAAIQQSFNESTAKRGGPSGRKEIPPPGGGKSKNVQEIDFPRIGKIPVEVVKEADNVRNQIYQVGNRRVNYQELAQIVYNDKLGISDWNEIEGIINSSRRTPQRKSNQGIGPGGESIDIEGALREIINSDDFDLSAFLNSRNKS